MTHEPLDLLASFVSEVRPRELAPSVRAHGVVSLLDAAAAALRAANEDTAVRLRSVVVEPAAAYGAGAATVWGTSLRSSAANAAQVNGTTAHAHFHDDTDMAAWSHPGSLIVPTCVAVAEREDLTASDVVGAVVCGYAALHWLGADGQVAGAAVRRGLRASSLLGPLAAAASAANLLGLDATATRNAIGVAADLAGGTIEPVRSGYGSWRLQNGWAGRLGVMAADLAARGQWADATALDTGWLRVATGETQPPDAWRRPPRLDGVLEVWQKHSATLGDNIAATACALTLHHRGLPEDVDSVVVRIARDYADYPGTSYRGPYDRVDQGLASTAFAVATALVHGSLEYDLQRMGLQDRQTLDLIRRIRVEGVDQFDHLDAEVEVRGSSVVRVSSAELPRSWFHHDITTAGRVLSASARVPGLADPAPVVRALETYAAQGECELTAREFAAALATTA